MMFRLIFALLLAFPALGGTFYVRPSSGGPYGNGNGLSWANAFSGFANAGSVGAGDTLYVAAGTYDWTVGTDIDGATNNLLRVLAAQDTHVGLATFTTVVCNNMDFVEFNGRGPSGETNFNIDANFQLQGSDYCLLKYFVVTNNDISWQQSIRGEMSHFKIDDSRTDTDTPLYGENSNNANAFDQTFLHHFAIYIRTGRADGYGPDAIHVGTGCTLTNFVIQAFTNEAYAAGQHQDLMQCYGDNYITVCNGEFIDTADSQIDFSNSGTVALVGNLRVYNNIFRRTSGGAGYGTVALRVYTDSGGTIGGAENLQIENNTFVDWANTSASYGAAIRLQAGDGSTTANNCSIQNNIIYNCGRTWQAIKIEGWTDNWSFSYNLVNAGLNGNSSTSDWVQSNGQSGAPSFTSYTPYALGNVFELASNDTAAKNTGTTLTLAETDRVGVSRPQGPAWDIGAFEFPYGESQASLPVFSLRIGF